MLSSKPGEPTQASPYAQSVGLGQFIRRLIVTYDDFGIEHNLTSGISPPQSPSHEPCTTVKFSGDGPHVFINETPE